MRQIVVDIIGVAGVSLVVAGVHAIHEPASMILAGSALAAWAYKASHR